MKELEVVGAVILWAGRVLCMQRPYGKNSETAGKFEFPGGKLESGEHGPEALERELREEMDMHVNVRDEDYFMSVTHTYHDFRIQIHSVKYTDQSLSIGIRKKDPFSRICDS